MGNVSRYLVDHTRDEGVVRRVLRKANFELRRARGWRNRLRRRAKIAGYFATHDVVKIQFGCAGNELAGFLNTDVFGEIPVDIAHRLPFPTASADLLYSSHVVEHIHNWQFERHLAECRRVLKPGGRYLLATPSLTKVFTILQNDPRGSQALRERHHEAMGDDVDAATLVNRLMHLDYGHRFLYDLESMRRFATGAGFASVTLLDNHDLPDAEIEALVRRRSNPAWDLETETYLLTR